MYNYLLTKSFDSLMQTWENMLDRRHPFAMVPNSIDYSGKQIFRSSYIDMFLTA